MDNIQNIVSMYDYDSLTQEKLINECDIAFYEQELGVEFGPQLKEYLLTYGYIGCEEIELLGINSTQMINSDMIKVTKAIHGLSDKTVNLIAIENQGDGKYYLVDSKDNIYIFLQDDLSISNINMDLFQYIEDRLKSSL